MLFRSVLGPSTEHAISNSETLPYILPIEGQKTVTNLTATWSSMFVDPIRISSFHSPAIRCGVVIRAYLYKLTLMWLLLFPSIFPSYRRPKCFFRRSEYVSFKSLDGRMSALCLNYLLRPSVFLFAALAIAPLGQRRCFIKVGLLKLRYPSRHWLRIDEIGS